MLARRKAEGRVDRTGAGGYEGDSAEMTPMQELVHTSTSLSSAPPAPASLFRQTSYGSESTVTSTASDAADDKGLLIATTSDEKMDSFGDEDEARAYLGVIGQSDSDSDGDDDSGGGVSHIVEVAAVVSNTDDPSIPCLTFRFWVMGLVSIFSLSFVNQVSLLFWTNNREANWNGF
jgi:hypothetical protein